MNVLPVIERELRVRARRPATYWTRFAFTLFVAVVVLNLSLGRGPANPALAGRWAFEWLLGTAFVLACAACALTADSISAERREGTLGLLFLTGLRGWEVAVGKLVSAGISAFYAVLALVPLLMLPLLAGGVTVGEAARSGLVVLATLFLALAAGVTASARQTDRFKAIRLAGAWVLGVALVPGLLQWPFGSASPIHIGLLSPYRSIALAQDAAYARTPGYFWVSLTLVSAIGAALLFQSGFQLRRSLRSEAGQPLRAEPGSANIGPAALQPPRPASPFTTSRPVEWLVARQRGQRALLWTASWLWLAGTGAPILFSLLRGRNVGPGSSMMFFSGLQGLTWLAKGLLAWAACRFFFEARKSGELELLVTTPLGAQVAVTAHWAAMRRLLRGPVLLMLGPAVISIIGPFLAFRNSTPGFGFFWPNQLHFTLYLVMRAGDVLLCVAALNWVGMRFGLTRRRQVSAVGLTLVLVEVVPGILTSLLYAGLRLFTPGFTVFWSLGYYAIHYVLLGLLIVWARQRLSRVGFGDPLPQGWQGELKDAFGRLANWIRFGRHWTPSA